ncbi:MAG: Ycf66 family protein [Cyanobacteriota bacterium]|nr:Ycf66 family protein [Cyanobacteriota bacterium]
MLTYILAIAVGLGSFSIYIAAFFFSEVHRKSDFFWSGVGLFYALILWTCAGRITGAVLLGQMASVGLLGWFGWQTLTLRRQVAPAAEQTKIPSKETTGKSFKFPGVGGKARVTTKPQTEITPQSVSTTETQPEAGVTVAPIGTPEETLTAPTPVADFPEAVGELSSQTEIPTVVETPTPSESATTETLKNLTEPTQTEIETKSELEIPSVAADTSEESEVKPQAKLDLDKAETKAKYSSKKKTGGFSMLLTPVNELVSNMKNAFGKKDKAKTKTDTGSKSVSGEIKSTAGMPETISDAEKEVSVGETKTLEMTKSVETEIQVTEKEEEGIAEVEIRETEEVRTTDGEREEATVVEKEAIAEVELTDSGEETPEVTIIKEDVTVTAAGVVPKEVESKEEEAKTQELSSGEEVEEVESPEVPSVELKKTPNQESDSR